MATFTGEVTAQAPTFNQIVTDYDGGLISYTEASNQFNALMNQIYNSTQADAMGFLDNSGADIDAIVAADFADFVQAFSQYYGHAMVMSSFLSYPVGYDRIDKFPGITMGFGAGTVFANVVAIQGATTGESATMFDTLDILPTLGLSLNIGVGIAERWSLRFSIFPETPISLPTSDAQMQDFNVSFRYGSYRARTSYLLVPDKKFGPGISLSGNLGYSSGNISVETNETTYASSTSTIAVPIAYTITATPSYNGEAVCEWSDYSAGAEIRLWWNLDFFIPYVGYGFTFQYSQISTSFSLNQNLLLEETATTTFGDGKTVTSTNSETVTRPSTVTDESTGQIFLNRLILGFEFKIAALRINTEVVIDPLNSLTGLSVGINAAF